MTFAADYNSCCTCLKALEFRNKRENVAVIMKRLCICKAFKLSLKTPNCRHRVSELFTLLVHICIEQVSIQSDAYVHGNCYCWYCDCCLPGDEIPDHAIEAIL